MENFIIAMTPNFSLARKIMLKAWQLVFFVVKYEEVKHGNLQEMNQCSLAIGFSSLIKPSEDTLTTMRRN